MADCVSLTLVVPTSPSLSFYAASQVPGLALPLTAFEDIAASSFVCITANGLVGARSFPIRPASAFIRTAVASGSQVYVQTNGLLAGLAGLNAGTSYFIHNEAGQITATVPASGIAQPVGIAVSADTLLVQIEPPTYLA